MRLLAFMALLASVSVAASAAEVAGVQLDERTRLGTRDLVLNGAGLRRKTFFRIYVAGLYLTEKRTSPAGVLALAGPKRASITLMRNIPAPDLAEALKDGVRENSSPEEHEAVKGRVDELAASLVAIRQCKKGDVITVDWLPDVGTLVVLNGVVKGNPVPGYDVYSALLRVWVGDRPASASLKRALLGQMD